MSSNPGTDSENRATSSEGPRTTTGYSSGTSNPKSTGQTMAPYSDPNDPKPVSPNYLEKTNKASGEMSRPAHVKIAAIETKITHLPADKLSMVSGPFHYKVRAGLYGEVYDEIPWRVMVGLEEIRSRDPNDRTVNLCKYNDEVLLHNCFENRRDRQYIRNHRIPISQYGHMYTTTYGETFGKKRVCNKERAYLQKIKSYPMSAVPAHQPELDVAMLRQCVPKPEECIFAEAKDQYKKDLATQKRYDAVKEKPAPFKYNQDLGKCAHSSFY